MPECSHPLDQLRQHSPAGNGYGGETIVRCMTCNTDWYLAQHLLLPDEPGLARRMKMIAAALRGLGGPRPQVDLWNPASDQDRNLVKFPKAA